MARSLETYQQLIDPYLEKLFPASRLPEVLAAMETLSWASFVAVSGAYFDAERIEAEALLSVLDAELSARNLKALLVRILAIVTHTFGATLGAVLLKDLTSSCYACRLRWASAGRPTTPRLRSR